MTRPVHSQPRSGGHQMSKCDHNDSLHDDPSEGENEDGCTSSLLKDSWSGAGNLVEDASIYEATQEMEELAKEKEICASKSSADTRVSGFWAELPPVVSLHNIIR